MLFESDPTLALHNAVLKHQEGDKTLIMTSKTSGYVSAVLSIFYSVYGQSQKLLTTNSIKCTYIYIVQITTTGVWKHFYCKLKTQKYCIVINI